MEEDFQLLETQIINLSMRWSLQTSLFYDYRDRPELFEWGAHAWDLLNRCLLDSIFMTIGRIMDPSTQGKRQNASLARLMEARATSSANDEIAANVAAFTLIYNEKILPWRNRFLAHRDRETALNPTTLPNVPREELEVVVKGILDVAFRLGLEIRKIDNRYDVSPLFKRGADGLMKIVERGLRGEREDREERRKQLDEKHGPLAG